MSSLWLMLLMGAVVAGWWYLSDVREAALAAAKRHCREVQVQFLDGSVSGNGFRLIRTTGGWQLVQRFVFEFTSTGEDRCLGRAEMIGRRVIKMELDAHKVH